MGISEEFSKYIGHIPDTNRDSFIGALLGRILILVKDPPHKWEVTRAAFEKMLQAESAAHIDAQKRSLPTEFAQSEVPIEQENELQDKRFVKAIHDIAYTQMVHDAISDYWKMDMTVFQYFHNDIVSVKPSLHKKTLSQVFTWLRAKKIILCRQQERSRAAEAEHFVTGASPSPQQRIRATLSSGTGLTHSLWRSG